MWYYLIVTLYVLVCGLLIITILLQQGKGGDIANAFGGGSSQAVFGRSGTSSVVGGIEGPPPAPAPAPINATPSPAAPATPPPGNSTP